MPSNKKRAGVPLEIVPEAKSTILVQSAAFEKRSYGFGSFISSSFFRKTSIVIVLLVLWQVGATHASNPLLFPTVDETFSALYSGVMSGVIIERLLSSLTMILTGYSAGIALATLVTAFASSSRLGRDFLVTITAMFHPLPAIALLPLALLWFGLGKASILFVLLHSVIWPMALNMHQGFSAVNPVLRMAGHNLGLKGIKFAAYVLLPAALPSIFSGLKISWALAWRTLIAAELVFGVSSGEGGIGWFIYENRNTLETANVFAGLITIIFIGLLVENLFFEWFEKKTIRKYGMTK